MAHFEFLITTFGRKLSECGGENDRGLVSTKKRSCIHITFSHIKKRNCSTFNWVVWGEIYRPPPHSIYSTTQVLWHCCIPPSAGINYKPKNRGKEKTAVLLRRRKTDFRLALFLKNKYRGKQVFSLLNASAYAVCTYTKAETQNEHKQSGFFKLLHLGKWCWSGRKSSVF